MRNSSPFVFLLICLFLTFDQGVNASGETGRTPRISGAAKFVRIDPEADFRQLDVNDPDCGAEIVEASGGEDRSLLLLCPNPSPLGRNSMSRPSSQTPQLKLESPSKTLATIMASPKFSILTLPKIRWEPNAP